MGEDFRDTLYTIDKTGRRKWVYADLVKGKFFKRRAVVVYFLMALYLILPWAVYDGEQTVFFDIPHRRFVFFGNVFFATDTIFLFLTLITLAISLFFFTSILGRVWCGWACPETVFLEFLFRPVERLIEGGPSARLRLDNSPWNLRKIRIKGTKYLFYLVAAWVLASTFLAYFIGRQQLISMMEGSPLSHPFPFFLTIFQMLVVLFQFGWFREQFCTVLCPYARFQSVLMDGNSLGVGYDTQRGEPRAKLRAREADQNTGDCIDCGLCVKVCPTGIDIRNGLQLECIHCAQCVDACNSVMEKVGREPGLIRYDTENRFFGRKSKFLRPRIVVYAIILFALLSVFGMKLINRQYIDAQILRGAMDLPFTTLSNSSIVNHLTIRIQNKDAVSHSVTIRALPNLKLSAVLPGSPYPLAKESINTVPLFLTFNPEILHEGKLPVTLELVDELGEAIPLNITLLGPG